MANYSRVSKAKKRHTMKLSTLSVRKRQCEVNQIIHTMNKVNICRFEKKYGVWT